MSLWYALNVGYGNIVLMKDEKECRHESLVFSSGDFIIHCRSCVRSWVHCKNGSNEVSFDHGQNLSGEYRNKPTNLEYLEMRYNEGDVK